MVNGEILKRTNQRAKTNKQNTVVNIFVMVGFSTPPILYFPRQLNATAHATKDTYNANTNNINQPNIARKVFMVDQIVIVRFHLKLPYMETQAGTVSIYLECPLFPPTLILRTALARQWS